MSRSDTLWLDSGERERGVGLLPVMASRVGYRTMPIDEAVSWLPTSEDARAIATVVVVMTADLDRIRRYLHELLVAVPKSERWFKIVLFMPDRGLPKSVQQFHATVLPESFDAIAHAGVANLVHARELFPRHRHIWAHNPVVEAAPVTRTHPRLSRVMMSGALASGKGYLPFYEEAARLRSRDFPVVHTGVSFTRSPTTGLPGGGFTELTALCSALKPKTLRPHVALGDYDSFDEAAPGMLTAFPPYEDRAANTDRIRNSKAFLLPILAVPTPLHPSRSTRVSPVRQKQLDRWTAAVEYSLFEALSTGTLVALSKDYERRMLSPLTKLWPLPTYSTVAEGYRLAADFLSLSPFEYNRLSQSQTLFYKRLIEASNSALDFSLGSLNHGH